MYSSLIIWHSISFSECRQTLECPPFVNTKYVISKKIKLKKYIVEYAGKYLLQVYHSCLKSWWYLCVDTYVYYDISLINFYSLYNTSVLTHLKKMSCFDFWVKVLLRFFCEWVEFLFLHSRVQIFHFSIFTRNSIKV